MGAPAVFEERDTLTPYRIFTRLFAFIDVRRFSRRPFQDHLTGSLVTLSSGKNIPPRAFGKRRCSCSRRFTNRSCSLSRTLADIYPWGLDVDNHSSLHFLAVTRRTSVFKLICPQGGKRISRLTPHVLNGKIRVDTQGHTFRACTFLNRDTRTTRKRSGAGRPWSAALRSFGTFTFSTAGY